jgi:hypothetical protein
LALAPPVSVDAVAKAVVAVLKRGGPFGIIDIDRIKQLADGKP